MWQKGVSGNPSGRPKDLENVRDLARTFTAEAIKKLAQLMRAAKSEMAQHAAANSLLERGWGKPLQQVEVTRSPLDGLTTEDLVGYLASVEKAIEAADGDPEKLVNALASVPAQGNA